MFVLQEGHNRMDQFPKGQILFRNFTKLSEKSLLDVLAQRNATRIRIAMNNSNIISLSEHLYFCEQLKADKTKLYTQVLLMISLSGLWIYNTLIIKKRHMNQVAILLKEYQKM